MTKKYILNFLRENKNDILTNFSIEKIGLFGSYSKNKANEQSDIDIVITSKKKDFFLRDDLKEYLEKIFNKNVDIGYQDSFRAYYKNKIEKDIIYV